MTITGPSGTEKTLTAVRTTLPGQALLVTPETMDQVAPKAPVTRAWVGLVESDAATVVPALQDTVAESSSPSRWWARPWSGPATRRSSTRSSR